MTATVTATGTSAREHTTVDRTSETLVDEHESLLRGVERRVDAVRALLAARIWPHSELATLTGYLRAALLRQVSDEESLLYPHDATEAPFAELSSAHARLYQLTQQLDDVRDPRCALPGLQDLVDELITTLRRHLTEEEAVLAALATADPAVPSTTALGERHQHWPTDPDNGPLVIRLDALPRTVATQLCLERLLRLKPGEQATVHSRDRAGLLEMRAWLHEFDSVRFGLALASDRAGDTQLHVACRGSR